ncbi:MAG: hypothetical protein CMF72_24705 [Mameliella sp.]|nr:hypothetical protein [Mameliella sp.]|tara:strand:+ start:326 stop:1744 length:1419 start_codon:yes stop_codon:yes gene_type:complete
MTQPSTKRLVRESDLSDPETPAGAALFATSASAILDEESLPGVAVGTRIATHPDVLAAVPTVPEGIWDVGTVYDARDLVSHDDANWIARETTTAGEEPGVSAKWVEFGSGIDAQARADIGVASTIVRVDTAQVAAPRSLGADTSRGSAPGRTTSLPAPIFTVDDSVLDTIYFPSIMRVDGLIDSPLGNYYMWYSSDHAIDPGGGGIAMAYADNREGPWTEYGLIISPTSLATVMGVGPTDAEQPEGVAVRWDEANERFLIFLSIGEIKENSSQHTVIIATETGYNAFSDTGGRIFIDADTVLFTNGHTGYQIPSTIAGSWVSIGLMGGGDSAYRGLYHGTSDGLSWQADPRPLGSQKAQWLVGLGVDPLDNWLVAQQLIDWRGQTYLIGSYGPVASGAAGANRDWCIGPVRDDLRDYAAQPVKINPPDQAWHVAGDGIGGSIAAFTDEGRLFVLYSTKDGFNRGFGISEVLP